jgi:ribonuclease PH
MKITRRFTESPGGSVVISMGRTKVLCTAAIEPGVPEWRKESGLGWLTAEYSMLPGSTRPRSPRARGGHGDGRGQEIQRLIGRVLRSVIDFKKLGANTVYIDCDVLEADGGTRTAAINGAYLALADATQAALRKGLFAETPLTGSVAAISVGIVGGKIAVDLDYKMDKDAQVDMNVAMTGDGRFVEIQGTAEHAAFDRKQLDAMLAAASKGIQAILALQRKHLNNVKGKN